jgi:uncharacterized protein involved in exopolysaccharide biosynthesis
LERNGNFLRFSVEFAYPDAARAERGASELASAMRTTLAKSGKVTMLDTSSLPVRKNRIDTKMLLAGGLLGGLAAGLLCATVYTLARNRQRWSARHVGSFAALGMAAGIAVAIAVPNQYISSAVIRSSAGEPRVSAMLKQTMSVEALAGIIRRQGLYSDELSRTPIEEVAARLRQRVKIQVVHPATTPEHAAIVLSVMDRNRVTAQQINRALIASLMEANVARMEANVASANGSLLELLDPASDPVAPSSPNRPQIIGLGTLVGMLLGLVWARWRRPHLATA